MIYSTVDYCYNELLLLSDTHSIIQNGSGITDGAVLNGELYAQKLQILIYLHLFTKCFMKISLQSLEQTQILRDPEIWVCSEDWREIFMEQSVNKCTFLIYVFWMKRPGIEKVLL